MASTSRLSTNLGLDVLPAIKDREAFTEFVGVYNAIRAAAANLDVYTGALQYPSSEWSQLGPSQTLWTAGANRLYLIFSDAATPGNMMSIWDDAGVMKARLAGGAAWVGGDCRGYATGTVNAGDYGEIILFGLCTVVSGLTRGATYWASNATTGAFTGTKPAANNNRIQPIGYALTDSTLFFNPSTLVPILNVGTLAIPVLTP